MRQTVDARLINGLWIRFPIYVDRIKPERKWCWLQIYTGIIIWGLSQCYQIILVLMSWLVSGFIL